LGEAEYVAVSTPFYADDVLQVAFWRNVAVVGIGGELSDAQMQVAARGYRTLRVAHPRGILIFCIVKAGVPVASPELRAETVRVMKELGESLLSFVIVFDDNGVFAQVMRSVIRGLNVMSRRATMAAFASVDEGIAAASPLVSGSKHDGDLAGELRRATLELGALRPPRASGVFGERETPRVAKSSRAGR
jgi:hypothetical protein